MAEVALERSVMGAEGPCAADPREGDDVRIVRFAEAGGRHLGFFASHLFGGNLPRDAGPEQLQHVPPRLRNPVQLGSQMAAED